MEIMRLNPQNRKIVAIIIAIAMVSTSMFIVINIIEKGNLPLLSSTVPSPSSPPVQSSPSYLSNITVKMNVSPSFVNSSSTNTTLSSMSVSPSFTNTFTGAVVELFASPSYPKQAMNDTNTSFYWTNTSNPLTVTYVNLTWNATFKLPKTIYNKTKTWKHSFGTPGSDTSMIIDITYFTKSQSANTTVFYYSGAVSYNPFLMNSGYTMDIMKHPYAIFLPSTKAPDVNITGNETIYPGFLNASSTPSTASPDYIPPPGGGSCKTYWGWAVVQKDYFLNAPIPLVYLNDSAAEPHVNLTDSLTLGLSNIQTGFTLSTEYLNLSGNTTVMGTTPTYASPDGFIGAGSSAADINPSIQQESVLGFYGNMSVTKYRYEEFALAGPNAGKVIAVTNNYSVSMEIDSLNHNGSSFIPFQMPVGNQTASKYNLSSFDNLSKQQKFAVAFGTLFTGDSLQRTFNGNGVYKGNLTDVSVSNGGSGLAWYQIYSGLTVYSPNSNDFSTLDSYMSIAIAVAGVALAIAAVPYSDAASVPAIMVSLLGLAIAVCSFNTAIISVQSTVSIYSLIITDSGSSNATLQYFFITDAVRIGNSYLNVPTAYFITK